MGHHKNTTAAVEDAAPAQSLSSLLLGKSAKKSGLDSALDDIFKTSARATLNPPTLSTNAPSSSVGSTLLDPSTDKAPTVKASKRKETSSAPESSDPQPKKRRKSLDADHAAAKSTVVLSSQSDSKKRRKSKSTKADSDIDADHEETRGDIEDKYFDRSRKKAKVQEATAVAELKVASQSDEEAEENDENAPPPQHESLVAGPSQKRDRGSKNKTKYVPQEETKEQRDERTIFIGNLPADVAQNKSALKGLTRLITSAVPGCKIESTRFRSIAFQNPTSELPKSDDETEPGSKPKPPSRRSAPKPDDLDDATSRQARQQGRAARWREQDDIAVEKAGTAPKTFLTPAEKKRVAFIKGELHSEGSTVHAYVVFAYEEPGRSKNVPPVLDPFEAAKTAVELCDGMVYMGRTIRVDHVGGKAKSSSSSGRLANGIPGHLDSRRTVFVGGLDFQTKEEDLRIFFEKLLLAENAETGNDKSLGANSDDDDAESEKGSETLKKPAASSWVSHVRLVRDHDTQLGKGFAYVEFKDRNSVDEVMAVEQEKLKLAKRKIRLERCKTKTASSTPQTPRVTDGERAAKTNPKPKADPAKSAKQQPRPSYGVPKTPAKLPKGDPALGDRLRGMDKDARHAVKAADPDRQARRLAKKKARNALEAAGVHAGGKGKSASGILGNMKRAGKPKVKAKVSRVRGEKSAAKRNAKK